MSGTRRRIALTISLALSLGAISAAAADVGSSPVLADARNRASDGGADEETAILERVRNYHQRHGDDDLVTSDALLRKTRWSYDRWLAAARQPAKGIPGQGWVSLGPNNGAGRATCVVPHPSAPDTVLAGAAGGGVWKTTDGGDTWRSLTDGLVSDLSVGALAYAPSDPDVLYLGTGEGGFAIDFIPGIGLVRSEDGGETWILPEYAIVSQFYALSVDPRDPDSLLAATNAGLLATNDGGVTWSYPLLVPDTACTEVVRSATNPDLVYAAMWCYGTCDDDIARVMRSTDSGLTWSAAGDGLPATSSDIYQVNRNALTVSPANDQILYLGLNLEDAGATYPPARVYSSDNGGGSWSELTRPSAYLRNQGWYDNTITTKPTDPNVVIAGGVYYVVSSNGGTSWTERNPYQGHSNVPHVDAHDLQWQGDTLWVACDGGIWRSTDDGIRWSDRNSGLITRQYYALTIDPVNRERVIAGSQDNGTDRRRDVGDDTWDDVLGGDGFECAINPLVPAIAHASIQFGVIQRSDRGGSAGSFVDVSPTYGADDTPFITLLTARPEAPWVLYTGSEKVWRSSDAGDGWAPLPTVVENGSWNTSELWAIAVTPANADVIMVAKNRDVYRSSNGGSTWRVTGSGSDVLSNQRVVNVEISPFDADIAVACMAGTSPRRMFRTGDGGTTWHDASEGLPPFSVQVARWDPTDPSVVYAGTDVGVYRSLDGGWSWNEYGDGFPAASVHDIRILPDGSMMRIATHGRGVWELAIADSGNTAPEIAITSPTVDQIVNVGDDFEMTASASDDDGDDVHVRWIFADLWNEIDGGSGSGALTSSVTYRFDVGGNYTATAAVSDSLGAVASASRTMIVLDPADDCESPRVIPGGGPFPVTIVTGNTSAGRASTDPPVDCTEGDINAGRHGSMWFELTPIESSRYVVSTCGSLADTVLSTWTGSACGPYTEVALGCNDDDEVEHCESRRTDSYLELDLEAGQTYRFMVGSWSSDSRGKIRFTVDCPGCVAGERPRRPRGRRGTP